MSGARRPSDPLRVGGVGGLGSVERQGGSHRERRKRAQARGHRGGEARTEERRIAPRDRRRAERQDRHVGSARDCRLEWSLRAGTAAAGHRRPERRTLRDHRHRGAGAAEGRGGEGAGAREATEIEGAAGHDGHLVLHW
jgi:hypothetical protein